MKVELGLTMIARQPRPSLMYPDNSGPSVTPT
jgi:hypothetical protein